MKHDITQPHCLASEAFQSLVRMGHAILPQHEQEESLAWPQLPPIGPDQACVLSSRRKTNKVSLVQQDRWRAGWQGLCTMVASLAWGLRLTPRYWLHWNRSPKTMVASWDCWRSWASIQPQHCCQKVPQGREVGGGGGVEGTLQF